MGSLSCLPRLYSVSTNLVHTPRAGQTSAAESSIVHLRFKGKFLYRNVNGCGSTFKTNILLQNNCQSIVCAMHMAAGAGEPDDHRKITLNQIMDRARKTWDTFPHPVKIFPWNQALDNFIQLVLDLILTVIKILSIPLLAVTSLSEMSYCAHERKLFIVPFPLLIGIAIAGVLNETALEASPLLKDAVVPWHLIAAAVIFTLIKLPGPYYPYWGRLFIPHLANGGIMRTLWFAFEWYRRVPPNAGKKLRWNSLKRYDSRSNES